MFRRKRITKKEMEQVHPYIPEAYAKLESGRLSRREFVRTATLLGMGAGVATFAAACTANTNNGGNTNNGNNGGNVNAGNNDEEMTEDTGNASGIVRGGTFTQAMSIQLIDHPARLSWIEGSNVVRGVAEYLTLTGSDNVTRPYLLESWEANDDVTEWTLNLRQGITFNNGDELTSDDIMFNFGQWLDEEVGSSMLGLLTYLDGMESVEQIDDYTIKLHLNSANIGVPVHLFHYPAAIMHRSFEGDFITQPIGTGAFTLEEFVEGERAVLKAREGYWQMGADGDPLPYLDEIVYVGIDKDAAVAAIQSGQVDSMYAPRPADWQALKDVPNISVEASATAQCTVVRMRTDMEPWNDIRVRNALKMCQNREEILRLGYFGEGALSIDAHISTVHPAYDDRPIPAYDPEGSMALLEEWAADTGAELPIQATIITKNDEGEAEVAQALKEMASPGGFEFELEITEPDGYWERWDQVPLGITAWTHRALGTMVLALGYIGDSEGVPVPWNETRWVDEEFMAILKEAEAVADADTRRPLMGQLQDIMQERGPIANSYWKNVWRITHAKFQNVPAHPTSFDLLYESWIDPEQA